MHGETDRPAGSAAATAAAVADVPPRDVDVELLDRTPRVAASFTTGVATGWRRPGARAGLPTRRLVLPEVRQDVPRLAGFCAVTGGLLGDTVPATWLHVLTFPLQVRLMAAKDFPFPMLGMVHVGNRMTMHRPVRVREELTLSVWAEHLAPHRKGCTVDLVGEVRVADEVVWEGRSTYLVRGASPAEAPPPAGGGAPATTHEPGRQLAVWRLPADLGRSYARVAGDANPIHLSALSARAFGFPRAIAHGMWTHARVLAAVQPRLPQRYTVSATFAKPVLLPSTVVLRAGDDGLAALAVTDRQGSRNHLSMQVSPLG